MGRSSAFCHARGGALLEPAGHPTAPRTPGEPQSQVRCPRAAGGGHQGQEQLTSCQQLYMMA